MRSVGLRPETMAYEPALTSSAPANDDDDEPKKIIIDCDPGADDALALILLIKEAQKNKNVHILGITVVDGNTELKNGLQNTLRTLKMLNAEHIPVYAGMDRSLVSTPPSDSFFGTDGFGEMKSPPPELDSIRKEHAVDALIRIVKLFHGQITIIATGPLTNIAMASRLYPNFRKDLKQLYVMGGTVKGMGNVKPGVEFNFYKDTESAYIIFNDTISDEVGPIGLLPWETCLDTALPLDWRINVLGKINNPLVNFINSAERISLQKSTEWISADPMLMATVLRPKAVEKTARFYAQVVLHGPLRGGLVIDWSDIEKQYNNVVIVKKISIILYKRLIIESFL